MKYKWIENLVSSPLSDEEVIDQLIHKLEDAVDLLKHATTE